MLKHLSDDQLSQMLINSIQRMYTLTDDEDLEAEANIVMKIQNEVLRRTREAFAELTSMGVTPPRIFDDILQGVTPDLSEYPYGWDDIEDYSLGDDEDDCSGK